MWPVRYLQLQQRFRASIRSRINLLFGQRAPEEPEAGCQSVAVLRGFNKHMPAEQMLVRSGWDSLESIHVPQSAIEEDSDTVEAL